MSLLSRNTFLKQWNSHFHPKQVFLYEANSPSKAKDDKFADLKSIALQLSEKYKNDGSRIAWVSIRLPERLSQSAKTEAAMFNSVYANQEILSFAVTDLALRKIGLDSLVMICSNGMTYKSDVLNRVSFGLKSSK